MEHEIKIIPDQKLAIINYKGPIEDLDILVSKLADWVDTEDVETEGEPFIVYYSPRHEVNDGDAVFDVGIVINEDADEKDMIRVVDMVEHKMLCGIHEGPTDNILDTYEELVEVAQANNYDIIGSPKEVFIKSVYNCDNEEMKRVWCACVRATRLTAPTSGRFCRRNFAKRSVQAMHTEEALWIRSLQTSAFTRASRSERTVRKALSLRHHK